MESDRTTQEKGTDFQLVASSELTFDDFGAGWKICNNCNTDQPLDNFGVEAKGRSGRKAVCKNCVNKTLKRINAKLKLSSDRIDRALEAAAYRIIRESM